MDLDLAEGAPRACVAECPIVMGRLGVVTVRCVKCGVCRKLTSAGRVDDARRVRVPCHDGRAPA